MFSIILVKRKNEIENLEQIFQPFAEYCQVKKGGQVF
jgi:hypothetical protein